MLNYYKTHSYEYRANEFGAISTMTRVLPPGIYLVSLLDWMPDLGGNVILVEARSPREAAEKRFSLLNADAIESCTEGRDEQRVHVIGGGTVNRAWTFTFTRQGWAIV